MGEAKVDAPGWGDIGKSSAQAQFIKRPCVIIRNELNIAHVYEGREKESLLSRPYGSRQSINVNNSGEVKANE